MKIARNLVFRPTSIALPGRSVHLGKGDEAPLSDAEAEEGTVLGLIRSKAIRVRDASDADKAAHPTFDETPNPEFQAVIRRRAVLARAGVRAAGGIA
jgi:hypothetical protein